jgi:hypothetical protein
MFLATLLEVAHSHVTRRVGLLAPATSDALSITLSISVSLRLRDDNLSNICFSEIFSITNHSTQNRLWAIVPRGLARLSVDSFVPACELVSTDSGVPVVIERYAKTL